MSHQIRNDNQQLSDTVAKLKVALERSEQRLARFERIFRWGALVFVLCLSVILSLGNSNINNAFAQRPTSDQAGIPDDENIVAALNKINNSMEGMRMMASMMNMGIQSALAEAMTAPSGDEKCAKDVSKLKHELYCYTYKHTERKAQEMGKDVNQLSDEQKKQFAEQAVMTAAGSVLVDFGILAHRIKQDSDMLRSGGLKGIKTELSKLNNMVTAIPIMANEMGVMNRQMSVMSHGVGSTMGRMGSWMPW